jgi:hypothetical protein
VTLRPTDAQDDVLAARLGAVAHEDPRKQAARHERHANQPYHGQQQDRGRRRTTTTSRSMLERSRAFTAPVSADPGR